MATLLLLFLSLGQPSPPQTDLSGAWAVTVVDFGRPNTTRMVLKHDGGTLTGTFGTQPLEGSVSGNSISFKVGNRTAKGTMTDGRLTGEVTQGGRTIQWSAVRVAAAAGAGAHAYVRADEVRAVPHVARAAGAPHRAR